MQWKVVKTKAINSNSDLFSLHSWCSIGGADVGLVRQCIRSLFVLWCHQMTTVPVCGNHMTVSKASLAVREVSLSEDDVIQEVDQVKQE